LARDNIVVSTFYPKMTDTHSGRHAVGARPEWVRERIKNRAPGLIINPPEKVAKKIAALIVSGETDIFV